MGNKKRSSVRIESNKDTPKIPYLMFTDDYIIFSRINKMTTRNIKQILDHYYIVSSQLVNYQKSRVQFSNTVSIADKRKIPRFYKFLHEIKVVHT